MNTFGSCDATYRELWSTYCALCPVDCIPTLYTVHCCALSVLALNLKQRFQRLDSILPFSAWWSFLCRSMYVIYRFWKCYLRNSVYRVIPYHTAYHPSDNQWYRSSSILGIYNRIMIRKMKSILSLRLWDQIQDLINLIKNLGWDR